MVKQSFYSMMGAIMLVAFISAPAWAVTAFAPSNIPVPEPRNLDKYVVDRAAGIQLGKALFWDMQLGSDGLTACATCHHHAGTDSRTRNTLHPGADGRFHGGGANGEITLADFPFVRHGNVDDDLTRTTISDDRAGTQGVNRTRFAGIVEGQAEEPGRVLRDGDFTRYGRNVRQSTGRTAPSVINAVFNFSNFWDGRAHNHFNGVDPFGPLNAEAGVWRYTGSGYEFIQPASADTPEWLLDDASLASQAVGPVLNDVEMSWAGRTWPDVARKMLSLRPLAKQKVHPQDSALGPLRHSSGMGLATSYGDLIRKTFDPSFWNGPVLEDGRSHMEANFSLYFGLALLMYQSVLVADQSPFDLWSQDPDRFPLPASAEQGRQRFFGPLGCTNCHIGPELTGASVSFARNPAEAGLIEIMGMGNGALANYDIGFYNIGVTPTGEDLGRGGNSPFNLVNPADGTKIPLAFSHQYFLGQADRLPFDVLAQPGCVNDFVAEPPTICDDIAVSTTRVAVNGAFKTPGLRNVELTGPYMHNGSMATLMQVVDFYARGGNFHDENLASLDPAMAPLGTLRGPDRDERKQELVDFLLALTDERVRWERAPFDHPQLMIPNGHVEQIAGNPKRTRILPDNLNEIQIPAVGRTGRTVEMGPLRPFLAPGGVTSAQFHYQP
jgi:cytochrome c peroxidase